MRALVFSPSGKHLLSVSDDKTMRVWDLATGRCVRVVEAHSRLATCIAWGRSRVGDAPVNVVATGSVDLCVKIWAP